ncbi:hypothetical protein ACCO45_004744 [Purpureocillium lilacinum]|uniref:Uncharacterized protein n=1 Tax=Purpureocillium lilacinum TaxID=33203 RepID=A0ACC4DUL1_PURLI
MDIVTDAHSHHRPSARLQHVDVWAPLPGDDRRRVARQVRVVHHRQLPAQPAPHRGGHPAAAQPPPAGPVVHHDAAQRKGPRHHPLGHRVRPHPRHPDPPHRPQRGPAPARLRRRHRRRLPRPSHADWTYLEKYGVKASSGGGRSSARETIARVAAGAVADKWLRAAYGVEIVAFVTSVGGIKLFEDNGESMSADPAFLSLAEGITREQVDGFLPVRCPHEETSRRMEERIAELRDAHDSTGGTVTCVIRNAPSGLGEPCFDKLEAVLAHAMMSIPAVKGFEIGSGFRGAEMTGSRHNDPFVAAPAVPAAEAKMGIPRSRLQTKTNNSGGIQGGISNGMPIFFRVAFKPPATISQDQTTARYDASGEGVPRRKGPPRPLRRAPRRPHCRGHGRPGHCRRRHGPARAPAGHPHGEAVNDDHHHHQHHITTTTTVIKSRREQKQTRGTRKGGSLGAGRIFFTNSQLHWKRSSI